jgi:hypothetical protein
MLCDVVRRGVRLFAGNCHDAIALMMRDRFHELERSRRERLIGRDAITLEGKRFTRAQVDDCG